MTVLDRAALEESPLADLHAIASELRIDGFRLLRKAQLVDAIVAAQEGREPSPSAEAAEDGDEEPRPKRRRRRRRRADTEPDQEEAEAEADGDAGEKDAEEDRKARRKPESESEREPEPEPETVVEGTIDMADNGSAFVRVSPPETSDDDVYVSAAQVRRCNLMDGDVISGPVRKPRRSERHPSLLRVETINGRPADEVVDATPFEELEAAFPSERFELDDDPWLAALEAVAPFGRGSRVIVTGPPHAGKSELVRRIAAALARLEDVRLLVVLAGARPEEVSEWSRGPVAPEAATTIAAAPDARAQGIERVIERGRRLAARGEHAVVIVDSLTELPPAVARRALAAARNLSERGSLTVIATAGKPVGGETTVITLDPHAARLRKGAPIDPARSSTLRVELLVGEEGAERIAGLLAGTG